MRYEPFNGFSFELPAQWDQFGHQSSPFVFVGPENAIGHRSTIQLEIGGIMKDYISPKAREIFLYEPGTTVRRVEVRNEQNVVLFEKQNNSELSIVRDGIHYNFSFFHDPDTLRAMELVKETICFPTKETAEAELYRWSDPKIQAVSRMLHGKAPIPDPEPSKPQRDKTRGFLSRLLGVFRSEPTVQKCETCSHQMQVLDFAGGGGVTLSAEDLATGIGHAEQCWECGRLYCSECYPSRPPNTCICGRGRDAVRHIRGSVFRGSLRLVKVRYIS